MAGMGVGEAALLSAAIGGTTAAARGGNPLLGAAIGALGSVAAPGIGSALKDLFGTAATTAATTAAPISVATAVPAAEAGIASLAPSVAGDMAAQAAIEPAMAYSLSNAPALEGITSLTEFLPEGLPKLENLAGLDTFNPAPVPDASSYLAASGPQAAAPAQAFASPPPEAPVSPSQVSSAPPASAASKLYADPSTLYAATNPMSQALGSPSAAAATPAQSSKLAAWFKSLSPIERQLVLTGGGMGLMALMNRQPGGAPGPAPYDGPLSQFRFNPRTYQPAPTPTRRYMAEGGLAGSNSISVGQGDIVVGDDPRRNPPVVTNGMAGGGIASLGSYSDGGRLLKGPGDGMSDNIPATIANKRPARLADGEFVVPADVVSHLGNGSTDAGAKQLYKMMDRVRKQRTGRKAQGKQISPQKFMPA